MQRQFSRQAGGFTLVVRKAPERMTAIKFDSDLLGYLGFPAKPLRTRPLCAYPKVARWDGTGSTDDAAHFVCSAPAS